MSKTIAIKNNKNEINEYILVSEEDYNNVIKYKWRLYITKDGYKSITGKVNRIDIRLSHFLLGKPQCGNVIDHIDNNSLNFQRNNLREITYSENSQNKKKTSIETSSKYIGVYCPKNSKNKNKWSVRCSGINLGYFENEIDAGIQYDKYVLLKFGEKANTNNLISFDEVKDLNINDLIHQKNKELPNNIYKDRSKYFCRILYEKKTYKSPYVNTVEEAIKELEILTEKVNELKKNKEIEHNNQEISRDEKGNAIIYLNKDKTKYTIVDDDLWHELSKYSWYLRYDNYIVCKINSKMVRMHRYILNAPKELNVDHIDNNPLNNKKENLRLCSQSQNCFNKTKTIKSTTSQFKGVSFSKQNNKFMTTIWHNNIKYNLGSYENEYIAGLAYNLKAQELFGEFSNLNNIELNIEKYEKYKTEILENWNKNKSSQFVGVTYKDNSYISYITHNKKRIFLGNYKNENMAGLAYNLKKIELNNKDKSQLKLNKLDLSKELYEEYKKEILEKWNK